MRIRLGFYALLSSASFVYPCGRECIVNRNPFKQAHQIIKVDSPNATAPSLPQYSPEQSHNPVKQQMASLCHISSAKHTGDMTYMADSAIYKR